MRLKILAPRSNLVTGFKELNPARESFTVTTLGKYKNPLCPKNEMGYGFSYE